MYISTNHILKLDPMVSFQWLINNYFVWSFGNCLFSKTLPYISIYFYNFTFSVSTAFVRFFTSICRNIINRRILTHCCHHICCHNWSIHLINDWYNKEITCSKTVAKMWAEYLWLPTWFLTQDIAKTVTFKNWHCHKTHGTIIKMSRAKISWKT